MLQFLAAVALVVSLADHWTTYLCLRSSVAGWSVLEANPLADWLFSTVGLAQGLLVDTTLTVAALVFLVSTRRLPEAVKLLFLGVVIASTSYAVANNLEAIFRLGLSPLGVSL